MFTKNTKRKPRSIIVYDAGAQKLKASQTVGFQIAKFAAQGTL
jgi:hypothetical protein